MFKEIRQALAHSEETTRLIAASRRTWEGYDSPQRQWERRRDQLDELNRLTRERDTLSRQLLEATTILDGAPPPAYVDPRDIAVVRRRIESIDSRIRRLCLEPPRQAGALKTLGSDLRVEMSVLGHQLLLMLAIVVANFIFFGILIWLLPYVWDWFWSFP